MLAAKNSKYVTRTFVTTDDENIMAAGRGFGMDIIERPAYLCTKDALVEDAVVHAMGEIRTVLDSDP